MCEDIKEKYYKMQVACSNCGKGNAYDVEEYEIFIPKGILADEFLEKTPCENCGCYTLARIINFVFPRLNDSKKKDKNKKDDDSEENINDINSDTPPSIFKKKAKQRIIKIIK